MTKTPEVTKEDLIRQQRVDILALKRLKVLDENNQEVRFSTFLEDKMIIIVFVRHFSCIACRAHVDQIWNLHRGLKKINTRIIFIGNGNPYVIKSFKEDMKVQDAEVYTDPTLEVFDACSMNRSLRNLINIKSLMASIELRKKGYQQSLEKDAGSHRQMGGVVAFKKPGQVVYHFTSKHLGDFDDPNQWPQT